MPLTVSQLLAGWQARSPEEELAEVRAMIRRLLYETRMGALVLMRWWQEEHDRPDYGGPSEAEATAASERFVNGIRWHVYDKPTQPTLLPLLRREAAAHGESLQRAINRRLTASLWETLPAALDEHYIRLGPRTGHQGWIGDDAGQRMRLRPSEQLGIALYVWWVEKETMRLAMHHLRSDAGVGLTPTTSPHPADISKSDQVSAILDQLTPRQREVIERCLLRGEKIAAVARSIGITPGTARAHLHFARRRLSALKRF